MTLAVVSRQTTRSPVPAPPVARRRLRKTPTTLRIPHSAFRIRTIPPHRPDTLADYKQRILAVLTHIQRRLDDDLALDELAAIACFSPFHFHRVFRGMVGESVQAHVRRLRLERAAFRLKFSDQQIVRLAFEAGYETHETFTRAFAAHFGMSPSDFRRTHRAAPYPSVASGVHYNADADIDDFQPTGATAMNVKIENIPAARVAFVRHIGPYDQVGSAWGRLFAWAGPKGLCGPMMRFFGLCHSDPDVTPPDRIQYDACLVVGPAVKPEGDIGVQDLPPGEYAVATHQGPYNRLGETYAALCGQWLPTSGRKMGPPPSIERYLNDPRSTPPEQLMTEVCLRLA